MALVFFAIKSFVSDMYVSLPLILGFFNLDIGVARLGPLRSYKNRAKYTLKRVDNRALD
jgi:hypothetical protein